MTKQRQKYVDNKPKRIYNCTCYAYFEGKVIIFINGKLILKGGAKNEKNLSAKEKRMKTSNGKNVLKRRRAKGRKRLTH